MLYGQKMKEILKKFGVDTNNLPNNLYSTMLDAIYNANVGSSGDGAVNTPTIKLKNGDVITNAPEDIRKYPFFVRKNSSASGYELYTSLYGFGKYSGKCYCLNANKNRLDGNADYSYSVFTLANMTSSWVYSGSGFSQVSSIDSFPVLYSNNDIYNFTNLSTKGSLYFTKNS